MPQVDRRVAKGRAERLRAAAADRRRAWLAGLVGSAQPVLVENGGKGHSDGFAPVQVEGAQRGQAGPVAITASDGERLLGAWA